MLLRLREFVIKSLAPILLGAGLVLSTTPADALTVRAAINQDGSFDTAFRAGDKPIGGATCPTGWTCATKGTGSGEIDEVSSTSFEIVASGNDDEGDFVYAYKSCGSSSVDCQVTARVPEASSWTGHIETFTSFFIGISDGTGDDAWYMQTWTTPDGRVRCKAGVPSVSPDEFVQISVADILPEYIAVTRDASANEWRCLQSDDGITYTTLGTYTRTSAATSIGYVGGTSHDTTATTTATLTNIDLATTISVYTPADPPPPDPPNNTPVFSAVPNQTGTVGVAYSFSVVTPTAYCTDADSDPLTYSASGLPSGLSMASNGAITGTPTTAQTVNATLTCTDDQAEFDTDVVQFTITASSGDVFTIATATSSRVFNCATTGGAAGATWASIRTSGTGTTPGSGDTIVLAAGNHDGSGTALAFTNCEGTASSPLTIRNDTSGGGPAVIRRTGGSSGGTIFECTTCNNVVIDGTGKWSGAAAGVCGATFDDGINCGIKITRSAGGISKPSQYLRLNGLTATSAGSLGSTPRTIRLKGILVDGLDSSTSGTGICFSLNDHQEPESANPNVWRDGIYVESNYANECGGLSGGEGFYFGPNQSDADIPLRNVHFTNNAADDPARDCYNLKSIFDGTNTFTGNKGRQCGTAGDTKQNQGINFQTAADFTISGNYLEGTHGRCLQNNHQEDARATNSPVTVLVENNIFTDCGLTAASDGDAFRFTRTSSASAQTLTVRSNTVATADDAAGSCDSGVNGEIFINNIFAGIGGTVLNGCAGSNNRTGTVASQNFVSAGTDDYHLTSASGACGQATSNSPSTDYDGDARPLDGSFDQGADEAAACP